MDRTCTKELIDDVDVLCRMFEANLYGVLEIDPQASCAFYSLLVLVVDRLKEAAQMEVDLACLEAVARDLDVIDRTPPRRPVGSSGYLPRRPPATAGERGPPPNQGSGGQKDATILMFRRLPPRPLYGPAGPGGAA